MQISKRDKIFVSGHRGLLGGGILENLKARGYENIVTKTRAELDLLDQKAVQEFFQTEKIDVVFLAAARVGGILANNIYRSEMIFENLQIQNNVVWNAHRNDVHRLVFAGSSCIYPRMAPQPMPETCLLTGELEPTNRPYALAKISGLEMVNALRTQHGRDYFSVMPTNLYGPRDNFDLQNAHAFPALVRKFIEAKRASKDTVELWGTGKARREFMFANDCADAIVHLAETMSPEVLANTPQGKAGFFHINVGVGTDVSIAELAMMIAEVVGFKGKLIYDATKPDGTPRKLLDVSCLSALGFKAKTDLVTGIQKTVKWCDEAKPF